MSDFAQLAVFFFNIVFTFLIRMVSSSFFLLKSEANNVF